MESEQYNPKKWLVDARTCDYFEDSADYDVLVRDQEYSYKGNLETVDLMEIDTEDRIVNYFNFYIQNVPEGTWDVPTNSEAKQLEELLGENNWGYMRNPRNKSWSDIEPHKRIDGQIHVSQDTDIEILSDLFETLTGDRELWKELTRIEPEQCR